MPCDTRRHGPSWYTQRIFRHTRHHGHHAHTTIMGTDFASYKQEARAAPRAWAARADGVAPAADPSAISPTVAQVGPCAGSDGSLSTHQHFLTVALQETLG